jgi:3-dehydroquinate synthase
MNSLSYIIESSQVQILFTELTAFLKSKNDLSKPVVFICDSNVRDRYPFLEKISPVFFLNPSEENKSLSMLESVLSFFYEHEIDKSFTAIIIGGGITCDIGSFAASVWHRGIKHVLVPTTLLAMTDAAIGGKTGINFYSNKNQIGTFYHPQQIILDISLLQSLSDIEFRQGLAEAIKHGIGFNESLFYQLEDENVRSQLLQKQMPLSLLQDSIRTKISIITQDANEKNIRKTLNIGHTVGHAMELTCHIKHGDAVALGILTELKMAVLMGFVSDDIYQRTRKLITSYHFPVTMRLSFSELSNAILHDKKRNSGELDFPVLTGMGKCKIIRMNLSPWLDLLSKALQEDEC